MQPDTSLENATKALDVNSTPSILVVNKTDLVEKDTSQKTALDGIARQLSGSLEEPDIVYMNALYNKGKNELERAIVSALWGIHGSGDLALSRTQNDALLEAVSETRNALSASRETLPDEVVALHIRSAVQALGILQGQQIDEEVLDRIFENFCIGK